MTEARWLVGAFKRRRFVVNAIITVAVVGGLALGLWLELEYDLPGEGMGIVGGVLLAAGFSALTVLPILKLWRQPHCPRCGKRWDVLDDRVTAMLDDGRCPHCMASL